MTSAPDVVILGGGPAGSASAIRLARLGRRVLLLEKSRFPRPKLCGGFLSSQSVAELELLGILDQVQQAGAVPLRRILVSTPGGRTAEAPLPGRAYYEDFPQLGNGIGGVRRFLDEVKRMPLLRRPRPTRLTLVTGELAAGMVGELAAKLNAGENVEATVSVTPNRCFGRSVTTAGLLTGGDILHALRQREIGGIVVIPATAVREGEGFLDGMTVEEVENKTGATVLVAAAPKELAAKLEVLHDKDT
jgi:hypothetical protein